MTNRKEIVQAAGRVVLGRVGETAILLLRRLIEAVGHVAGIVVVGDVRAQQLERARDRERPRAGGRDARNTGIIDVIGHPRIARDHEFLVGGLDVGLAADQRQRGQLRACERGVRNWLP